MKVQIQMSTPVGGITDVSDPIDVEHDSSDLTVAFISCLRACVVQPGDTYTVKILDED